MEKYLNRGIKDVITEFPEVGRVLDAFNIGCAPCSVGTCLLKDIVEIHNLSPDEEERLMRGIAGVIYPGAETVLPKIIRKPKPDEKTGYSPPMKKLVEEHVLIKRFLAMLPALLENLDVETAGGRKRILDCVDFIRSYADRYHHAKEEEILFTYFDGGLDIIRAMLEDHKHARAHVREIVEATERGDDTSVRRHLTAYGELLAGHIKREDEILYPWMDRNLSMTQIGALFSQFAGADGQCEEVPKRATAFVESLEKQFQKMEVES